MSAVVGEADKPTVEGSVPKRREQEPVVHVEALRVGAVGPRYDVGSPEQPGLGYAGHRAAAAPIIHQGIAEYVLADPLDYHPFGLGRSGEIGRLGLEAIERSLRQARGELVDTVERCVQLRKVCEHKSRKPRPMRWRGGQR